MDIHEKGSAGDQNKFVPGGEQRGLESAGGATIPSAGDTPRNKTTGDTGGAAGKQQQLPEAGIELDAKRSNTGHPVILGDTTESQPGPKGQFGTADAKVDPNTSGSATTETKESDIVRDSSDSTTIADNPSIHEKP